MAALRQARAFTSCSSAGPVRIGAVRPRPSAPARWRSNDCCRPVASACSTSSSTTSTSTSTSASTSSRCSVACAAGRAPRVMFFGRKDPELTVAKLQVGVFGDVDAFQRSLDRIAGILDGDEEDAMGDLVHDVVVLLSRNTEYAGYAQTALFMTDDFDELEQQYNKACLRERSKFKQETFSNVGGRITTASLRESGTDVGLDKWLVVTLILAAEATLKLPKMRSLKDLQEALEMLGSLPPDLIVAVELLWTPQERGDSYSKDEMLTDYPKLVTL